MAITCFVISARVYQLQCAEVNFLSRFFSLLVGSHKPRFHVACHVSLDINSPTVPLLPLFYFLSRHCSCCVCVFVVSQPTCVLVYWPEGIHARKKKKFQALTWPSNLNYCPLLLLGFLDGWSLGGGWLDACALSKAI